tara:strand:- start:776 stop:1390 length:615 start_codon:yes stop_codon:yes gene_type:complete
MFNDFFRLIEKNILRFLDIEYFFSIPVKDFTNNIDCKKFIVKEIDYNDLDNFKLFFKERGISYKKTILKYLDNKDEFVCLIVKDLNTNNVVYSCCIRNKTFFEPKINKLIELKNNEVFFTDAHCIKEFRKQGLHSIMMRNRIRYCYDNDINKAYIVIQAFNKPAIKLGKKLNYNFIEYFIKYNSGSISYYFKRLINKIILKGQK